MNSLNVIIVLISISMLFTIGCIDNSEDKNDIGPFESTINIDYSNQYELDLIEFCEKITPFDNNPWYDNHDGILIADTVCNTTIDYYLNLVEKLKDNSVINGLEIQRMNLTYNAWVRNETNTSGEKIYIINLSLRYITYIHNSVHIDYNHFREVTIDEKLNIINISGDNEKKSIVVS